MSPRDCLQNLTAWNGCNVKYQDTLEYNEEAATYFIMMLLYYMRQEVKILLKNKRKPLDMLDVHDSQCGFLKVLVNPFFLLLLSLYCKDKLEED